MGSTRRQRMRRKFDHMKNRKKAWKKSLKKPVIGCEPMRAAWDERKSLKRNLNEMGLSYDPNKTLPIPKREIQESGKIEKLEKEILITKPQVVQAMEEDAYAPRLKTKWTTPETADFCMKMMDKHGDDYVAMARDPQNIFQHTPKQIKRKIDNMKKVPGLYEDYLASRTVCLISTPMAPRKKTRRYDASRRNGHFTSDEQTPRSSLADKRPPSITKARRRLQFGRKPPKDRSNIDTVETEDQYKEAPLASPLNGTEIETDSSSQQQPISDNGHTKRRNPGTRLKKELQFLLDDADHEVYPVRLRSALHELMSCHDYQRREKIPVHRTQEKTDLVSPPSTNRQH